MDTVGIDMYKCIGLNFNIAQWIQAFEYSPVVINI